MSMFLGIDLGLRGALALLSAEGHVLLLADMPTLPIAVGKRTRHTYDVAKLAALLDTARTYAERIDVLMEDVYHLGFKGSLAARSMGYGAGAVAMWCASRGQPLHAVMPAAWKKVMLAGRAKGKGASRARAAELFPSADLGKRNDEGRAEALLLASYGQRLLGREP